MPIGNEDKKEIKEELVVGKSAKEPVSKKAMFDVGEASLDGADTFWDKRHLVDHGLSPFGLEANT
jgi:hypothetical protein